MVENLDAFYNLLQEEVETLGLKVLDKAEIRSTKGHISETELDFVRRNFLVDFGEYGFHLPDFDRVIYDAKNYEIRAVIFSSPNIAWGIAESAYWKMKYGAVSLTKHIKVCFIALGKNNLLDDEDKLKVVWKFRRELDGCYTLPENSECKFEFSSLNMLIDDVKNWAKNKQKVKK